jgi:hypothetical protein
MKPTSRTATASSRSFHHGRCALTTSEQPKDFDAIEFKRHTQARIVEAVRGMTPAEEIAYYRRLALYGPLDQWWTQIPDERSVPMPSR